LKLAILRLAPTIRLTRPSSADFEFYASSDTFILTDKRNSSERLRIDSSGRVGVGTTTVQAPLHIGTASAWMDIGASAGNRAKVGYDSNNLIFGSSSSAGQFIFKNNVGSTDHPNSSGSELVRIDSSGRLLVGTSANIGSQNIQIGTAQGTLGLYKFANNDDGGELTFGTSRNGTIGSQTIVNNNDFLGRIFFRGSDGSAFLRGADIACQVDGTPGTNDMPGRLVFSTTADGAASPGERMRITSDGNVLVGKTSSSFGTGDGTVIGGAGYLAQTRTSATPFTIIRNGTDGTLVSFEAQNVEEGTISVSGTTVSYNGAHLSRWSQILGIDPYNKAVRPEILRGTVMSNLDEMCDWTCPTSGDCQDNEQLNKTKISDVEGDKNVAGIFQSWDDDDDTWVNDYYLAMTGDFVIRIAAGTTVERGDLLMSAGDGTAKPQADDLVRSCTVAKVTSANVSCTYDDGSYCVPCVLMAC
jgi:hypothetical protein